MQTSHFQLSLIALLAVALGASVSSSEAIGYPTASAISASSNPIWNVGGTPTSVETITAPSDQDIVITDIHFGSINAGWLKMQFELLGEYVAGYAWDGTTDRYKVTMSSGIRIPAGETMTVRFDHTYSLSSTQYTLSGYYGRP